MGLGARGAWAALLLGALQVLALLGTTVDGSADLAGERSTNNSTLLQNPTANITGGGRGACLSAGPTRKRCCGSFKLPIRISPSARETARGVGGRRPPQLWGVPVQIAQLARDAKHGGRAPLSNVPSQTGEPRAWRGPPSPAAPAGKTRAPRVSHRSGFSRPFSRSRMGYAVFLVSVVAPGAVLYCFCYFSCFSGGGTKTHASY
ncbi:porimin isoform X2 [Tamandua tetradactyla]|uniref:porimin isoform X2 n=1 Tax=Tamandua tetradactyla TaxID=48850 RepID=UPI0040548A49